MEDRPAGLRRMSNLLADREFLHREGLRSTYMANEQTDHETVDTKAKSGGERALADISMKLVRSDLAWVGRGLMKLVRIQLRNRSVLAEHGTTDEGVRPTGPYKTGRLRQQGDLLLWVPRSIDGYLIDELTGGYGYSHATIDTGEIDLPTGKPVMAEITVKQTVSHKFIDEYGQRAYVRIPLRRAGVNIKELVACVESKMGEQYDSLDALTLGEIQDPAREVCSGLITDCLPPRELRSIALARKLGLLHRRSISVHSGLNVARVRAFVSPNGLAEYYGAPRGRKVTDPDVLVRPRPVDRSLTRAASLATRHQGWKAALALLAVAVFIVAVRRRVL